MPACRVVLALLALLLAAVPRRAEAQAPGALELKVTEPDGAPLAGAVAKVDGVPRGITGADGRVRVHGIAPGWHALKVTQLGHRGVALGMMVPPGGTAELEVGLEPSSIRIAGVTGTARRDKGILVRAPQHGRLDPAGLGRHFTREDIDRSRATTLTALIVTAPGVELLHTARGPVLRFRRALAALPPEPPGGGLLPPDCAPAYYVDGVRFATLETPDVFPPAEIEEVVLFPGNVPAAYGGVRASCGVVVIRTRGVPLAAPKPRALHGARRGEKAPPRPLSPKAARTLGKQPVPKAPSRKH
jgi:hypothetical protein